jgi:hypothetical protein
LLSCVNNLCLDVPHTDDRQRQKSGSPLGYQAENRIVLGRA